MKSDQQRAALPFYLVIFLAGFTFLVYEVCWNRLLSLVLGTTVMAATIVLASFMAGFGTGAYFWGRLAQVKNRIGLMLAALLAGVGLFSTFAYLLITRAIPFLYSTLAAGGVDAGVVEILIFALSAILLFVPTFLMGGVFPLLSKVAVSTDRMIAPTLGRLYASETLGSTLGGLATGFVLLGALGQKMTLAVAVIINLSLAVWLVISQRLAGSIPELGAGSVAVQKSSPTTRAQSRPGSKIDQKSLRQTALLGAFTCGFCILGLQVLWLRAFRIYLTNTSYTFALVSSLAILGLFTGSAFFARSKQGIMPGRQGNGRGKQGNVRGKQGNVSGKPSKGGSRQGARSPEPGPDDQQRTMFRVLLYMGLATGLGLLLLINLPQLLMFPFQAVLDSPLARVLLLPGVASLLIVFPPAVFSGYAFPLACSMYTASKDSISRDVGFVLMVNTLGSVLGPVAVAFILLPLLGVGRSLLLVVVLLVGATLLILQRRGLARSLVVTRNVLYVTLAVLALVIALAPKIRILPPSFSRFERNVLFYRESVEGTLSVGKDRGTRAEAKYTYVNNSAVIGSTYDAVKVVKMVGHFPFFMGLECRRVLVIGFGIGVTTSAIAAHPEVESIVCVELVAGLKDAARYYQDLNRNVVADPRLQIIAGDGRHYLQQTPENFDLISCDPTHPILGSGNLYTREYFEMCREHLNPGGMVSQYLPLHKLRTEEFLGLIATFHAVFPHCTVWLGHYHAVLLGSLTPLRIDFADWAANVASIGQDSHLYVDPYHFAATLMLDGQAIAELASGSKINTDDRSYTEFFAPACLDEDNIGKNLRWLMEARVDIGTVFENIADQARMARFIQGNQLLTESLFYRFSGDNQRSLQVLRDACRVNPEDREYPFLIQLYY
jgi:spermidine synthase